jgi:hypothetical protein
MPQQRVSVAKEAALAVDHNTAASSVDSASWLALHSIVCCTRASRLGRAGWKRWQQHVVQYVNDATARLGAQEQRPEVCYGCQLMKSSMSSIGAFVDRAFDQHWMMTAVLLRDTAPPECFQPQLLLYCAVC